jgi:hypothetical protein
MIRRFVQIYHDATKMTPMEIACVDYNQRVHGAELLPLDVQDTTRESILAVSDRKRFEMAIDDQWLRYADCDTRVSYWPELPQDGLPRFANGYGNPDIHVIDWNGVNPDWIFKILAEWDGAAGTIQDVLRKYWSEWKFLPKEWYIHKPRGIHD